MAEYELYHGDCLEVMKGIEAGSVDAVITDPPYGIGESGQTNKTRGFLAKSKDYGNKDWDKKRNTTFVPIALQVSDVFVCFGGNYYADLLPPSPAWIAWER